MGLPEWAAGPDGMFRFSYTDEHGLTCQRMVGNWRCEGGQLTGYCLNRKQEESFGIERIGGWEEVPVPAGGRSRRESRP